MHPCSQCVPDPVHLERTQATLKTFKADLEKQGVRRAPRRPVPAPAPLLLSTYPPRFCASP